MTQFNADIGAVNALGQQLEDVSSSASNVLNGAVGSVSDSHGAIGFPMQSPLDGTQASRSAAVAAAQAASGELGDLLRQAAQAYERGDTAAAERLKARAVELESSGGQGGSPAGGQGIVQAATQGGGDAAQTGAETLEKAKAEGAEDGVKPPIDAKDGKDHKPAAERAPTAPTRPM